MKNKLLMILVIVTVIFQQKAFAQLPQVSTETNPIWYYIQVKGSENGRELMVWTVEGSTVFGRTVNTENQTKTDEQLFRFEKSGENYILINKGTNKKVDAVQDGDHYFVVNDKGLELIIRLINGTPYYGITVTKAPGNAANIYAHQGNSGYTWKVILTTSDYGTSLNSQFSFVPQDQMNLEYSTDKKYIWYTINGGQDALSNKCIVDVSSLADPNIKISLENVNSENDSHLWKLVKKTGSSNIDIINKATGNIIQTKSDISESNLLYNYTQVTEQSADSKGWILNYVGAGQYVLAGEEEDDITRYMNATTDGTAPEEYNENNLPFSTFAWKFNKVKTEEPSSLPTVQEEDNIRIYSVNRVIVVEGSENYTIRTIQGIAIGRNIELPVGVYLVTVNGKTTKLLVK